ncbi:hypothetical protein J1614_006807 [Plenodomus biglobosus]|nr:hypothetical protein J1614_006807 [Plenodomus biglobosus]
MAMLFVPWSWRDYTFRLSKWPKGAEQIPATQRRRQVHRLAGIPLRAVAASPNLELPAPVTTNPRAAHALLVAVVALACRFRHHLHSWPLHDQRDLLTAACPRLSRLLQRRPYTCDEPSSSTTPHIDNP